MIHSTNQFKGTPSMIRAYVRSSLICCAAASLLFCLHAFSQDKPIKFDAATVSGLPARNIALQSLSVQPAVVFGSP
jgi:hypothetical protein